MSKFGKYLLDISVVVIGVAITLCVGYWISMRSVKKDVALSINAIKIELEQNANAFDDYANRLKKSTRYNNYLRLHDEKSISQDSIEYYAMTDQDGIGWGQSFAPILFTKNAFEMLKTSGTMRYITDRKLLEKIWITYSGLGIKSVFL